MRITRYTIPAAIILTAALNVCAQEQTGVGDRAESEKAVSQGGMIRVDGAPLLKRKSIEKCTLIGSLRASLAAVGDKKGYDDLLAVSGAAFQVNFYPWSTGPEVLAGLAFPHEALSAVGRAPRWLPAFDEKTEEEILASLRSGIPVVALGVSGQPEFGVIVGYDSDARKWFGRSYLDQGEADSQYQELEGPGRAFVLIGGRTGTPLSKKELVERALLRAVSVMKIEEQGTEQLHGFGALRWWADSLRTDTAFERIEAEGSIPAVVKAHEWMLEQYIEARGSAVRFLRRHIDLFSEEERPHVEAGADAYAEAAQLVLARGFKPYGEGHPDPDIAERSMRDRTSRHQTAGILELIAAREKEAVKHLEAVLEMRRDAILKAYTSRAENETEDPTASWRLAEAQYVFGDYEGAAKSYRHCVEVDPSANGKAQGRLRVGMCLYRLGKDREAIDLLVQIPSVLKGKNDPLIRAIDRRLAQWEVGRRDFSRFFGILDEYIRSTGIDPFSTQIVIAHRKWVLGDVTTAKEDYKKLTSAPLDWVAKSAERVLRDINAGLRPADPLAL